MKRPHPARPKHSAVKALLAALGMTLSLAAAPAPISLYTVEALRLVAPGCRKDCSEIEIEYPRILKALNPEAQTRINQAIQQAVIKGLSFEEKPKASLQAGIDAFFTEAAKFQKELPDGPPWQLMLTIKPESYGERLLSLRVDSYVFAGGAHGSPHTYFLNFDLQSGQPLALDDLLVPGARKQLDQLGEQRFISDKGKIETYDFENQRFYLPQAVGLAHSSLIFFYNVYEIGPYAAGPTELYIDYYSLQKLIKPEYISSLYPESSSD